MTTNQESRMSCIGCSGYSMGNSWWFFEEPDNTKHNYSICGNCHLSGNDILYQKMILKAKELGDFYRPPSMFDIDKSILDNQILYGGLGLTHDEKIGFERVRNYLKEKEKKEEKVKV